MKVIDEIKKPSISSKPDFSMSRTSNPDFTFECKTCNDVLGIDFQTLISNAWTGKTNRLTDEEKVELKEFYGIGLSNKSHEGGLPIFDKITCLTCKESYIIYGGVMEYSNSAYDVTIHGILVKG